MEPDILEAQVQNIRLSILQPDKEIIHAGHDGPHVRWHIHSPRCLRGILKHPQRRLATSYIAGDWDVRGEQLATLIEALLPGPDSHGRPARAGCLDRLRHCLPMPRRDTVAPQWIDDNLWLSRQCLGEALFHHCALYNEPGISAEQAQRTRNRDLVERLQLKHGQHILDANAGWGGLAIHLAETTGVRVTAMVRSRQQLQYAHHQVRRRALEGQVHLRLGGFRQCQGRYDRILAAGLLEHSPEPADPLLFGRVQRLLADDGLAWVQVTGATRHGGLSHTWLRRQLSARHRLPLLSELTGGLENTGLRMLTLEDQSAFLLQDLLARARRFHRQREAIARRFGERRTRHWEFLLASQIAAFRSAQLRHYELLIGQAQSQRPATAPGLQNPDVRLPMEIARKIPGLARDL